MTQYEKESIKKGGEKESNDSILDVKIKGAINEVEKKATIAKVSDEGERLYSELLHFIRK